jgi:hypothetical protein
MVLANSIFICSPVIIIGRLLRLNSSLLTVVPDIDISVNPDTLVDGSVSPDTTNEDVDTTEFSTAIYIELVNLIVTIAPMSSLVIDAEAEPNTTTFVVALYVALAGVASYFPIEEVIGTSVMYRLDIKE